MNVKSQKFEYKKVVRQVLPVMTEIVFQMAALVFERIESFVFNFPARPAGFDQLNDVLSAHLLVAYPAVVTGHFLIHFEPILKKIDLISIPGCRLTAPG